MFSSEIDKFVPQFSLMSFNIRYDNPGDGEDSWGKRKEDVAIFMQKVRPKIFSLQEPLKRQVVDMKNAFPDFEFVGVGRTDGAAKGEYNPIFYDKDLFHLVDSGTFWLSPTPEKPGSRFEGASLPRICTWCKFKWLTHTEKDQPEFYVLNTHLDHESSIIREKQIRVILGFVKRILDTNLPVVFMGDFNADSNDPSLKFLISTAIFKVASLAADACITANTFTGFDGKSAETLDHVFFTGFHVNLFAVLTDKRKNGRHLSDHRPVFCLLKPQ